MLEIWQKNYIFAKKRNMGAFINIGNAEFRSSLNGECVDDILLVGINFDRNIPARLNDGRIKHK